MSHRPPPKARLARPDDAMQLARIYALCFPDTYLAGLGQRYLRHFYRCAATDPKAVCVVVEDPDSGRVGGVALALLDLAFYKRVVKSGLLVTAWACLVGFLRSGAVRRKLWQTLRRQPRGQPGESIADDALIGIAPAAGPVARYVHVAVHPACRRRGLARCLLTCLAEQAFSRGAARLISPIAIGNVASQRLHESLGWNLRRSPRGTNFVTWLDRDEVAGGEA